MSLLELINNKVENGHDKADLIIETLATHEAHLARLVAVAEANTEKEEYLRRTGTAVVAGDGTVEIPITLRFGYVVKLLGFAATMAANTGSVAFYMNSSENGQNLLWGGTGAQLLSDVFPTGTMLPEGSTLVCRFAGLPAGSTVTLAITGQRDRLHDPHII